MVTILDDLHIRTSHILGYSMGGEIAYAFAKYAPERVTSLLIGGMPAQANVFSSFSQVDGTDPEAFCAAVEVKLGVRLPPAVRAWMSDNDLQALAAAAQDRPSLEEVLPSMTIPCLLFVGEATQCIL